MNFDELALTPWSSAVLCRLHILCAFRTATFEWDDAAGKHVQLVHWALGWVANGECEQLGAWVEPAGALDGCAWTVANLKGRGLERILLVTGERGAHVDAIADAFSSAPAFAAIGGVAPEGLPVLWRRMSASRLRNAEELSVRLNRAIRRHGAFEGLEAATEFVAKRLQREERRLNCVHAERRARS